MPDAGPVAGKQKMYIMTVQRDVAVQTVAFAASHDGSRPFGPASALRHYIDQVGWHLDVHGHVTGPEHYGCNILDDSIKKIVNTFKAMWVYSLQHCLVYGTQRYW